MTGFKNKNLLITGVGEFKEGSEETSRTNPTAHSERLPDGAVSLFRPQPRLNMFNMSDCLDLISVPKTSVLSYFVI